MMPGTTIVSAWWFSPASRVISVPGAIRKFVARAGLPRLIMGGVVVPTGNDAYKQRQKDT